MQLMSFQILLCPFISHLANPFSRKRMGVTAKVEPINIQCSVAPSGRLLFQLYLHQDYLYKHNNQQYTSETHSVNGYILKVQGSCLLFTIDSWGSRQDCSLIWQYIHTGMLLEKYSDPQSTDEMGSRRHNVAACALMQHKILLRMVYSRMISHS